MAYIVDFAAAHTLASDAAKFANLDFGSKVCTLPFGTGRESLTNEAYKPILERNVRADRLPLIHTGQTRNDVTNYFGTNVLHTVGDRPWEVMVSSACASGVEAVVLAGELIDGGSVDTILVLAASSPSPGDIASFAGVGALASTACRPFDLESDGVILGSFAGAIVVSRHPAPSSVRIIGTGSSITGLGAASRIEDQVEVMQMATRRQSPDVVVAHATGTQQGDAVELAAISYAAENVWKKRILAVSHKGALGHTVQAAGIASIISALISLRTGFMYGSYGLQNRLPHSNDVALPGHADQFIVAPGARFLVNGFGFGGNNFSLLLQNNPPFEGD